MCYDLTEIEKLDKLKKQIIELKKKSLISLEKYKKELKKKTLAEIN